ncbi:MAG: type II toxin-antitoxin system VapB family antitoxin [Desulfuromonadaceae bacterium]|nr:type II toxin-antitoxin system VapB family antitoxin [Desulfuromonadaceae bacterium]
MRATIAIDDDLFKEAFALSNVKTKKELITLSLQEFIRKKRLEHLAGMYSSGAVTVTCEELEENRDDDRAGATLADLCKPFPISTEVIALLKPML